MWQVTAYAHKDENNRFLVKRWNSEGRSELDFLDEKKMNESMEIELVRHGDLIRLEHVTTRRNVHAHSEKAPLSKKQFQVTGYGEVGFHRTVQGIQGGPSGRGQPFVDIAVSVVPLYKKIMLWQNFSVHQMGHPIIMLVHFINHTRL